MLQPIIEKRTYGNRMIRSFSFLMILISLQTHAQILTMRSGTNDKCPGFMNGSECQEVCILKDSKSKPDVCMQTTVRNAESFEQLRKKMASTEAALKVTRKFDLPEKDSSFYTFANNVTKSTEFCGESSKFLDNLIEARRTCPSQSATPKNTTSR